MSGPSNAPSRNQAPPASAAPPELTCGPCGGRFSSPRTLTEHVHRCMFLVLSDFKASTPGPETYCGFPCGHAFRNERDKQTHAATCLVRQFVSSEIQRGEVYFENVRPVDFEVMRRCVKGVVVDRHNPYLYNGPKTMIPCNTVGCGRPFDSFKSIVEHKTQEYTYCALCVEFATTERALDAHIHTVSHSRRMPEYRLPQRGNDGRFPCGPCGISFPSKLASELHQTSNSHLWNFHNLGNNAGPSPQQANSHAGAQAQQQGNIGNGAGPSSQQDYSHAGAQDQQ